MIKIENVEVVGWEHVIRGMRNPKNSWELSDSRFNLICDAMCCEDCPVRNTDDCIGALDMQTCDIGPNDHKLMMSLAKGGPVHAKYRRMIVVYLDITAPLYWWKEFDTYKVGTVANSCSTMHKIHDKKFTLEDFSCEDLGILIPAEVNDGEEVYLNLWEEKFKEVVDLLNNARNQFNREKNPELKKKFWRVMIQYLPTSYNQKRTVMLNYEVLHNMYFSRKNHKLDEWRELCAWIEGLPYSEIITTKETSEFDIYEDLVAGKISINEARQRLGLELIDVSKVHLKDYCLYIGLSEEQMNEIIDKFNSIPN